MLATGLHNANHWRIQFFLTQVFTKLRAISNLPIHVYKGCTCKNVNEFNRSLLPRISQNIQYREIHYTWCLSAFRISGRHAGNSLGMDYTNRLLNVLYWSISLYLLWTIDLLTLLTCSRACSFVVSNGSFLSVRNPFPRRSLLT